MKPDKSLLGRLSDDDGADEDGGIRRRIAAVDVDRESSDFGHQGIAALVPDAVARSYALKFVISFVLVLVIISAIGGYGYVQTQATVQANTEEDVRRRHRCRRTPSRSG